MSGDNPTFGFICGYTKGLSWCRYTWECVVHIFLGNDLPSQDPTTAHHQPRATSLVVTVGCCWYCWLLNLGTANPPLSFPETNLSESRRTHGGLVEAQSQPAVNKPRQITSYSAPLEVHSYHWGPNITNPNITNPNIINQNQTNKQG